MTPGLLGDPVRTSNRLVLAIGIHIFGAACEPATTLLPDAGGEDGVSGPVDAASDAGRPPRSDAGIPDGGEPKDASSDRDGGPPIDEGDGGDGDPALDAGLHFDGGGTVDSGDGLDGGAPFDAGPPFDAGRPVDGGPAMDAGGTVSDGGSPGEGDGGSCGLDASCGCTGLCADAGGAGTCGDHVVDATEECDDGNRVGGDGCGADCLREAPPGWICLRVYYFDRVCDCGCGIVDPVCPDAIASSCFFSGCPSGTFPVGDDNSQCAVPECGDGLEEGSEACDDGNIVSGDGCSASCDAVEPGYACPLQGSCAATVQESEPNDDGSPSVGAQGIAGNDFSSLQADGPFSSTTVVSASIFPAGDEDVFAVTNPHGAVVTARLQTFGEAGLDSCPGDTGIHVRDAVGVSLAVSDDEGAGPCSRLAFELAAGQTLYVHVAEFADNDEIASYFLLIELTQS